MGVIKSNKATNALLVFFSCVYSGSTVRSQVFQRDRDRRIRQNLTPQ
jgi:hypothetical protein